MTRDVLRALGRRWYVLVTGLLLTVGLAVGAYHVTPPNYTATGLVLLLPSKSAIGAGGNPFLGLSDLDQPAGILVAYFSGASAQADVKAHAPTAKYQVMISASTRGPIIEVDVTDKTAAATIGALDYITRQIPIELHRLQTQVNAPPNAIITSMPLTIDSKAQADYSGTIRIVISAVVVGLLITGLFAFALDGLIMSRRARRAARAEAEGSAQPGRSRKAGKDRARRQRERGRAEQPPPDEAPAEETAGGPVEQPDSERPDSERPDTERPDSERPDAAKPDTAPAEHERAPQPDPAEETEEPVPASARRDS